MAGAVTYVVNREQVDLTEKGQISDRFFQASGQLGSQNIYERTAGVEAIEQIVLDAPDYTSSATERLVQFIRIQAPTESFAKCPSAQTSNQDIEAAITTIGMFNEPDDDTLIDLSNTCLRAIWGTHLDFSEVDFSGADLTQSAMVSTSFRGANFDSANLSNTRFGSVDFSSAVFCNADFTHASFVGSKFSEAVFDTETQDDPPGQLDIAPAKIWCIESAMGDLTQKSC